LENWHPLLKDIIMAPIASKHLMPSHTLHSPVTTLKQKATKVTQAQATSSPPSAPCLVTDLIRYQVETNPEAFAVHCEHEEPYTYHELWQIVEQIALNARFVSGSIVPVCLDPTIEFVAGLLAIMASGAAYVVLDPEGSPERNRAIVADTGADSVLSNHKYNYLFEKAISVEDLLSMNEAVEGYFIIPPHVPGPSPSDLAYLIYTSGEWCLNISIKIYNSDERSANTLFRIYRNAKRSLTEPSLSKPWDQSIRAQRPQAVVALLQSRFLRSTKNYPRHTVEGCLSLPCTP
jgi:non-ribosomal peptide synthetase component F